MVSGGARGGRRILVRGPYTLNGYFAAERDNERCFDPTASTAAVRSAAATAIWWSPGASRMSSAVRRSPASDLEEQLLDHPAIFRRGGGLPDQYLGKSALQSFR